MESKASTSPSNSSRQQQCYLAVDRLEFKMETLLEVLRLAGRRPSLSIVLCCNSRDELDYLHSEISVCPKLPTVSLSTLHSDQTSAQRASVLEKLRQTAINWKKAEDGEEIQDEEARKCQLVIVTDACLPLLGAGESPINAPFMINYELPTKKEAYMRRMATCLSADGILINLVAGCEVITLRNIEENSGIEIPNMPMNITEWLRNNPNPRIVVTFIRR